MEFGSFCRTCANLKVSDLKSGFRIWGGCNLWMSTLIKPIVLTKMTFAAKTALFFKQIQKALVCLGSWKKESHLLYFAHPFPLRSLWKRHKLHSENPLLRKHKRLYFAFCSVNVRTSMNTVTRKIIGNGPGEGEKAKPDWGRRQLQETDTHSHASRNRSRESRRTIRSRQSWEGADPKRRGVWAGGGEGPSPEGWGWGS